jgi:hypothetical protein
MVSPVLLKAGGQAIGAASNFMIASSQAKMQEAAQAFGNSMRMLSAAQQTNSVTLAEAQIQDKSARLSAALQTTALKEQGAATVSAAAAGIKGNSVQQAMIGLRRSAIGAQNARLRNTDAALLAQGEARKNIKLAAILGQDVSIIPQPSVASALLGLGAQLIDTYDENQPKGSKSADGARLFD